MKQYKYILMAAVIAGLSSCADDRFEDFRTAATDDPNYAYLNDLGDLKSYVDHAKYPTFKLCGETNAAEFNKQELVYALDVANFEELVTGNAFKYSSVVGDDGSMNFGTIKEFVKNASEAGLSIFGHTLVWHSQQNTKYLNNLIADKKVEVDPNARVEKVDYEKDWTTAGSYSFWAPDEVKANISVDGEGFKLVNKEAIENWQVQYHVADGMGLKKGNAYKLKMTIKGSGEGTMSFGVGDWGSRAEGSFTFNEQWKEYEFSFSAVADGGFVLCQTGKFVGTLQIKDVQIVHSESPMVEIKKSDYLNDFESGEVIVGWGNNSKAEVKGGSHDGSKAMVVTNPSATDFWSCQRAVDMEFKEGTVYSLHFWAKADTPGTLRAGFQNPSDYSGMGDFPSVELTKDWKEYTVKATAGAIAKRFLFSMGNLAGNIYFDDIELYHMEKGNSLPLTDEEKKDTLTWAMDNWIQNMMKNCEGKVKSWDVVNEPMSDAAPSELKTATRDGGEKPENNFFWQDYLGKDYARVAVKLARQYGGNDLKLFINDYNLEAAYNKNAKCEGLIKMVEYWESDGVTKIDGIGSQMHVTYSMNKETQAKNEEAVTNMLNLLAKTGKLIRISELDMGIADEAGNKILTQNVTEAQHKAMAKYYQFIIDQYLKIIPANQQYGVCAWGITDSPKGSGWRAEEPIGLWDGNYHRKHTYAGFASGLSGQNLVPEN